MRRIEDYIIVVYPWKPNELFVQELSRGLTYESLRCRAPDDQEYELRGYLCIWEYQEKFYFHIFAETRAEAERVLASLMAVFRAVSLLHWIREYCS